MRRATVVIVACVALVMGLSACSDANRAPQDRLGSSTSGAHIHNDADVAFLEQMIPHHAQAIEMSDVLVATPGADPQVVAQARSIRIRQASEIAMMRGWLTTWGVGAAAVQPHRMAQCGMVSSADLAALNGAEDAAADRLYLELMIAHHAGAIAMARMEADAGASPFATDFARGIMSSQQREIDVMRSMATPDIVVTEAPSC
ncbi:hypothetical protein TUM20985_28910 [Mycobacterium antarcticum]|uniref:DUF305 domain-containing protein n=1 Tax=unclassified Mycolicibacterium TaxID=2636767 RepID=UPI0023851B30|nr:MULTISPECIES: DUF305 domain-containing protein [unclassified Mycolicibacterium]BDX32344.1 hypothetical protein TUM20985_28910 [Mycolicibacterium sp. TUM20985]GLP84112.1 hypothetical protein TUM20984_55320 [Mycolicibacterium sp. TUM20984]